MKDWKFEALWAFALVVIVLLFFSLLSVTSFAEPEEEEPEKKEPFLPPTEPPKNVKNATLTPAPPGFRRTFPPFSIIFDLIGIVLLTALLTVLAYVGFLLTARARN